ncbi:MAG: hypothetical protein U5O15_08055 [Candidatus Krumholzibacteriota bacterium]|nr:hypothetical protein [Candidatus Krumholzibacteriota bacterium]
MSEEEKKNTQSDDKEEFGYQPIKRGHQPKESLDTNNPPEEPSGVPEKPDSEN